MWEISGGVNSSNASGRLNAVNQQSGLFAGKDGYHITADSVDLQGGAIGSTAAKEHNQLTTNSLTFKDIENHSSFKASNISINGGFSGNDSYNPTLPQYESGSDHSTTHATISPGQITINGKETSVEELGIHSDIDSAHRNVKQLPDLQQIMDKQQAVAEATAIIANSVRTLSADMARKANQDRKQAREKAEQELQTNNPELWQDYNQLSEDKKQLVLRETSKDYRAADEQAQSWGIGGNKSRALNAVTSAVTGILGGQTSLQAATNALAPYAAELIGKQFGHGDNKNQAAQLVAHALLGAITASVNGGNALAGAAGASAAELAAQYLIKQLPKDQYPEAIDPKTGEIDPNRLPESVKANIRDLSSAVATVSGGITGGSLVNAQIAGVAGQNAVENNELDLIQLISPASAAMLSKDAKHREAMKIAHQIRMASSAITIVQVGGGYAIAGVGLVAPEAIGAIYSACRVNPAGCTVVTVESADILAGVATGAVTVSNLPASAIKSTSKIGGKYAEEIGQIGKEASKGSAKVGKEAVGSLTGQQTKLPPNASAENIRSLQRENESAKILSQNGYHVKQNPMTSGIKNPDHKINGEIFDNYAPSSSNIRNIWREVDKKVQKCQTNSVVINLADSKATVADLQKQFKDWPIKGLNKVIVIDRSGKAVRIK